MKKVSLTLALLVGSLGAASAQTPMEIYQEHQQRYNEERQTRALERQAESLERMERKAKFACMTRGQYPC